MSLEMVYSSSGKPKSEQEMRAAEGTRYALTMINDSSQAWVFYVYQKPPRDEEMANVFSLAWLASPYKIRNGGDSITFDWGIEYNFVWSETGILMPGVTFEATGKKDCDPAGANTSTFSLDPGPGLDTAVKGEPEGSLVIHDAEDVQNGKYSVGIGMSGMGTYAVQAGPNLQHIFTPTPHYWIAAGVDVKAGKVLDIATVTQTKEVEFSSGVYELVCTLQQDNTWKIESA